MKKIDLKNIDIQKLSHIKVKRKIDAQILVKQVKQQYERNSILLREKIYGFVNQFDLFQKRTFALYILIICGIFLTLFFTFPLIFNIFQFQENIVTAKKNIVILQSDLDSLKNIDSELKGIHSSIVKMGKMVPVKPEEENIVVTLGTLLAKNFLVSPSRISWNQEKETMIDNPEIRDLFDVYSYSFTTQGSYENIQKFIQDLRKNLRIIDVKSVKMVPLADGNIEIAFLVWAYNLKTLDEIDETFEEEVL